MRGARAHRGEYIRVKRRLVQGSLSAMQGDSQPTHSTSMQGCMPPKMVLEMGIRNGLEDKLPFRSEEEAAAAFNYQDLQEFLDLRDATLQVNAQATNL